MGARNIDGVRKVTRAGRPVWIIDFRYADKDGQRQRYRRDAEIQSAAGARAEAARRRLLAMQTGSPEEKKLSESFRHFVEHTFEEVYMPKFRPSTRRRYRALLRQGVMEEFGPKPLVAIRKIDIAAYETKLVDKRGIKPRPHINLLRTVLEAAVEAEILEDKPEFPVQSTKGSTVIVAPRDEHVQRVLGEATGWLRTALWVAAFVGARSGELRAAKVGDIDLEAHEFVVRRAFSDGVEGEPKSGSERRQPLTPEAEAVLREAMRDKLPSARLVTCQHGGPPSEVSVRRALYRLLDRLGIPRFSPHSLRRWYGTTLLVKGANVESVRKLLGHGSLSVTLRYLAAAGCDAELKRAVGRLGSGN